MRPSSSASTPSAVRWLSSLCRFCSAVLRTAELLAAAAACSTRPRPLFCTHRGPKAARCKGAPIMGTAALLADFCSQCWRSADLRLLPSSVTARQTFCHVLGDLPTCGYCLCGFAARRTWGSVTESLTCCHMLSHFVADAISEQVLLRIPYRLVKTPGGGKQGGKTCSLFLRLRTQHG